MILYRLEHKVTQHGPWTTLRNRPFPGLLFRDRAPEKDELSFVVDLLERNCRCEDIDYALFQRDIIFAEGMLCASPNLEAFMNLFGILLRRFEQWGFHIVKLEIPVTKVYFGDEDQVAYWDGDVVSKECIEITRDWVRDNR